MIFFKFITLFHQQYFQFFFSLSTIAQTCCLANLTKLEILGELTLMLMLPLADVSASVAERDFFLKPFKSSARFLS